MKAGVDYPGVAVGVLLIDGQNRLFLTKRGANATNERGTWEFPGGKIHFGETLEEAAQREMREEYGVDITCTYQFPAQNHLIPDEHQHWVPTTFVARLVHGEPKILEPDKCDEIGWFGLANLPHPLSIITKLDIESLKKYLRGENVFSM